MSDRLYIFDTTLRDGEQVPGCQLNTVEKIQVAKALEELGAEILRIQAHGDLEAARAWVAKYGVAGPESLSDKRVLEKAGIPVDIRFNYE